jgi:ribosomal protein S3
VEAKTIYGQIGIKIWIYTGLRELGHAADLKGTPRTNMNTNTNINKRTSEKEG